MNEELLTATLKVIIDGQAYLYARLLELQADNSMVTIEQFKAWEDDWKNETADLIQSLLVMEDEIVDQVNVESGTDSSEEKE